MVIAKISSRNPNRPAAALARRALAAALALPCLASAVEIQISGKGWIQAGQIVHSTDTAYRDYNGNWFQSANGQVSALALISEAWEGALGLGARQFPRGQGGASVSQGSGTPGARLQVAVEPYIVNAYFTYTHGGDKATTPFQLTLGYFPYKYQENVRNLGLYLTRGTVYPGLLFSGFEADETIGIANLLGLRMRNHIGMYYHDILLSSETKLKPLFDYSVGYIGRLRPSESFEIGLGANFYRFLPINDALTTPRDPEISAEEFQDAEKLSQLDNTHYYLDTTATGVDTIRFTSKGIKVGAFFSADLKGIFGQGPLGPEDLKIYGEACLIGVLDYKGFYTDKMQRLPVMLGLNLPMFNLLDHLSFELEWYGSPYRNDYQKLELRYSAIPMSNKTLGREVKADTIPGKTYIDSQGKRVPNTDPYNVENMHQDDIKWSLHGAKTFANHIRISGQVANDHFRPGGDFLKEGYESAFTTLNDWYYMLKISYFF